MQKVQAVSTRVAFSHQKSNFMAEAFVKFLSSFNKSVASFIINHQWLKVWFLMEAS